MNQLTNSSDGLHTLGLAELHRYTLQHMLNIITRLFKIVLFNVTTLEMVTTIINYSTVYSAL